MAGGALLYLHLTTKETQHHENQCKPKESAGGGRALHEARYPVQITHRGHAEPAALRFYKTSHD